MNIVLVLLSLSLTVAFDVDHKHSKLEGAIYHPEARQEIKGTKGYQTSREYNPPTVP